MNSSEPQGGQSEGCPRGEERDRSRYGPRFVYLRGHGLAAFAHPTARSPFISALGFINYG